MKIELKTRFQRFLKGFFLNFCHFLIIEKSLYFLEKYLPILKIKISFIKQTSDKNLKTSTE